MRIAYLVDTYPMPSQTFIGREIRALEAQGFAVDRYGLRAWEGEPVDPADREESRRTRFVQGTGSAALRRALARCVLTRPSRLAAALRLTWRRFRSSDRRWRWHAGCLAQACLLLRWLEERPASHLHAHFATAATEVAMLCRALGGPPYSFTLHGIEEIDRAAVLGLDEKAARAEFLAVVSDYTRSRTQRRCRRRDHPKIHVVRCGLEASDLVEARHLSDPAPASRRFVCVGRLREQKGQLLLIEAAYALACEGAAFELLLVGDGPLRNELEARIRSRGLEDRVELVGWQTGEQVRKHLLDCRSLVLPSFAEGLPVVIMEALALGRPVISTFVAGIPELVDASCGWLVPAGSAEALVRAMRDCLATDPERLHEMGRAGAARVHERHDVHREAAKLAALIRDSAAAGPGA